MPNKTKQKTRKQNLPPVAKRSSVEDAEQNPKKHQKKKLARDSPNG
jgi:hypothetical protein